MTAQIVEWVVLATIAYLFCLAFFVAAWPVFVGPRDDDYLPSERYAEDFAARMSGLEKPGSSRPCPFQHGEDASPGEGPGDVVYSLGAGPRDLTTRPTPAPPARRSAAETDRPLHIVRP